MNISSSLAQLKEQLAGTASAEKIIKAFIRYSPSPLVMLDDQQRVLIWTQAFCEEFGLDLEEDYSNKLLFDLVPCCYGNNKHFHDAIVNEESVKGRLECSVTCCVVPKKCAHITREYYINPWPRNGHMGGVVIHFKNITKEIEFENVLNTIPGYIFYKDTNNVNTWVNDELAKDMQLNRKDMLGKSWFDLDPENGQKYWLDDQKVITSGKKLDLGLETINIPTGKVEIHMTKMPWFDNFGNIKGVIGFGNKVKKRKGK